MLDTLFHALVRWAAPVLVFTSEEVWGTRFPEGGSVHLLEWPELPTTTTRRPGAGRGPTDLTASTQGQLDPGLRRDAELVGKWRDLRTLRSRVNECVEPLRREKEIGSSLEAAITLYNTGFDSDTKNTFDFGELFISSGVDVLRHTEGGIPAAVLPVTRFDDTELWVAVTRTTHHKCGRCWRHLPEVREDGGLCSRCDQVVAGMDAVAHV